MPFMACTVDRRQRATVGSVHGMVRVCVVCVQRVSARECVRLYQSSNSEIGGSRPRPGHALAGRVDRVLSSDHGRELGGSVERGVVGACVRGVAT